MLTDSTVRVPLRDTATLPRINTTMAGIGTDRDKKRREPHEYGVASCLWLPASRPRSSRKPCMP